MLSIILCEGESDAILISYYLLNTMNFEYKKKLPASIPKFNDINNSMNWYKNEKNQYAAIWAIGGSNFKKAINKIQEYNNTADIDYAFIKIILIMDNDDELVTKNIKDIGIILDCDDELTGNKWTKFPIISGLGESCNGEIICILQPEDEYGALETFVLQMISEKDKNIVEVTEQVKIFVDNFKSEKYLKHRREKIKAKLSISLDVMYPSKTFTPLDEFLKQIEWKNYQIFQNQFSLLNKIIET